MVRQRCQKSARGRVILSGSDFHAENHYVPCVYLKGFTGKDNKVETYRTLVSHPKIPLWKRYSVRGIAFYTHLYTRITAGGETDEIERWLGSEYESPTEEPLQKAISDLQLKPTDWEILIRFAAAQSVRTPARLLENLQRWQRDLPNLVNEVMEASINELAVKKAKGEPIVPPDVIDREFIPFRVTKEHVPGEAFAKLQGKIVAGRGLWLFSIRSVLTNAAKLLHQHRWTILKSPQDISWFTSDDPVIPLNFQSDGSYNFAHGWGVKGAELMLPLSPRHLLYTQIGEPRPPCRGTIMERAKAQMVRRFIAEHAHRMIFAASPDEQVEEVRPRMVNDALFREEQERWRKLHEENSAAERKLMGWSEPNKSGV